MAYTLPQLPYATDALAPHISAATLDVHHGKHHKTYVDKLNELTGGEGDNSTLEAFVLQAKEGPEFNNAGQHWNHSFYWQCLSPDGGGTPPGELDDALSAAFGSVDTFLKEFADEAAAQFGSGWAWLAHDGSALQIMTTSNADLPQRHGAKPLLTVDVWEHAYYLDYKNKRPDYLSAVLEHVVNWDFVAEQLRGV
jgi:Fe-Mn family superoxide dismutase